jgi:peptidyl-tRNA hydrolase
LRIGVGRPAIDSHQSVADYVLENVSYSDLNAIDDVYGQIITGIKHFLVV